MWLRLSATMLMMTSLLVVMPRRAFADDDPEDGGDPNGTTTTGNSASDAFPLVVPHEKHWVRAGLEVGGVLVVGFVDYLLNTGGRGGLVRENDEKWAFRYDWQSLHGKLVGTAYELDANKLGTNYASHPLAGTAYYEAARSNHLSFAESLLFATLGSTTWEYFGELRERNSINDMIVTPMSGAAIGEPLMQLAGFFDRGRDQASNKVLSFLIAPIKAVNDFADGAVPRRAKGNATDALGFSREPWHRFHVYGAAGMTVQEPGLGPSVGFVQGAPLNVESRTPRASQGDVGFGLETEIVNLRGYRGATHRSHLFDDGNLSSIRFGARLSRGELVDMTFASRVVPVGFYWREAGLDSRGRLAGQSAIVGLRMGFEYGMHDYDRDRQRPRDLVSIVSPIGIEAEYAFDADAFRVRTGADISGSIAGVTPYALADWIAIRGGSRDGLPTVTKNEGYYHAFGVGASPFVELGWRGLILEGRMRLESFRAIEGLDEANDAVDRSITLRDKRTSARATLGWEPPGVPLRLSTSIERRVRVGEVGDVARASRSETSFLTTLGALF